MASFCDPLSAELVLIGLDILLDGGVLAFAGQLLTQGSIPFTRPIFGLSHFAVAMVSALPRPDASDAT